ncbi:DedA family protein [Rhodococcus erythropolis]|uniref:DedA family protein n=1 Tax=Rhodococcus erythropolis TaxID=1833 RepID=UPI0037894F4C
MIDWLSALPAWLVVLVIGASILVESGFLLGLVMPGTTAVIAMGVMVGLGVVPAPVAYVVAIAAAVAGPTIGWRVGRVSGPALRTSRLGRRIPERSWQTAERVVDTQGRKAVAVAQYIVGARTLVPLLVGMSTTPYARFAVVSIPAATVWSALLTAAGQLAGASYQALTQTLGNGTVAIAIVAGTVVALGFAGRFVASQPQWGLRPPGDESLRRSDRAHAAVDRFVTARVGARQEARVTAVLWWSAAVLTGLATCAAMVWAVQHSNLDAVDRSTANWVSDRTSDASVTAAKGVDFVLNPSNVLLLTYLLTLILVVRHRSDADRPRRTRAVTISLGLAALAVPSEWVASFARDQSATDDPPTHFFDLQVAIVPCALAIVVVLLTPWVPRLIRLLAWAVTALLTGLLVASRLVLATMNLSEVVMSLALAAAWAALLINIVRPPMPATAPPPEKTPAGTPSERS